MTEIESGSKGIELALENFIASDDFKSGVIASTKASWSGGGYSVELFDDGTYRVLWNNMIGNKYDSPGEILGIPTLDDHCGDDQDMKDFFDLSFANEQEEIEEVMRLMLGSE